MFPAFLAALFFALSATCAHRTARLVGGFAANCARLWLAGIFLALWAHLYGRGLHGAGLGVFVLSGVVGFGMGDLAMFAAFPLLGARLTALMVQCLAAPMAALIEWLWLGTRLDARQFFCGAVIPRRGRDRRRPGAAARRRRRRVTESARGAGAEPWVALRMRRGWVRAGAP